MLKCPQSTLHSLKVIQKISFSEVRENKQYCLRNKNSIRSAVFPFSFWHLEEKKPSDLIGFKGILQRMRKRCDKNGITLRL